MELLFGVVSIFIIYMVITIYKSGGKTTSIKKEEIKEQIENTLKDKGITKLDVLSGQPYDLYVELEEVVFLVKIVSIARSQEIVITNKFTWILNNKKNNPKLNNKIPGVKEFIEHEVETNKKIKKIAIIYPGAHNILKYINECEMVIVNPTIDVHGCRILQYNQIAEIENFL